jgi:hypothetical protein
MGLVQLTATKPWVRVRASMLCTKQVQASERASEREREGGERGGLGGGGGVVERKGRRE